MDVIISEIMMVAERRGIGPVTENCVRVVWIGLGDGGELDLSDLSNTGLFFTDICSFAMKIFEAKGSHAICHHCRNRIH